MFRLLIILLCCLGLYAQQPLPYSKNGKWGLCNRTNGNVICLPAYQFIETAGSRYFKIYAQQKVGLMDTSGKIILPTTFDKIEVFNSYFALKDKRWALFDADLKALSEYEFDGIHEIQQNLILFSQPGRQKLLNTSTDYASASYPSIFTSSFANTANQSRENSICYKNGDTTGVLYPSSLRKAAHCIGCDKLWTAGRFGVVSDGKKKLAFYCDGERIELPMDATTYTSISEQFIVVNGHLLSSHTKKAYRPHSTATEYSLITDSLIAYKVDGKYGIMNYKGDILMEPFYCGVPIMRRDQYILFCMNQRYGIMDKSLRTLIPAQYGDIDLFKNNLAVALGSDSLFGVISIKQDTILRFGFSNIKYSQKNIKAYRNGGMLLCKLDSTYSTIVDSSFYENVKTIQTNTVSNRAESSVTNISLGNQRSRVFTPGMVTTVGEYKLTTKNIPPRKRQRTIIPGAEEKIGIMEGLWHTPMRRKVLKEEYWDIRIEDLESANWARVILQSGKASLFKTSNDKLVTRIFASINTKKTFYDITYIGPIKNGYARINIGGTIAHGSDILERNSPFSFTGLQIIKGKWGYLDANGNLRDIKMEYEYASDFHHGKAIVALNGKYGIIDSLFQWVVKPTYPKLSFLPASDFKLYMITRDKKETGIIDLNGKPIIQGGYDRIANPYGDWIAIQKGLWGFCDLDGNIRIEPKFEQALSFHEGLAAVREKNLWGYIDKSGAWVIKPQYRKASAFYDGVAAVIEQQKWVLINTKGEHIRKQELSRVQDFYHGKISARKDKGWGVLNEEGKWVLHPHYKKIIFLKPHKLIAAQDKHGWKIFSLDGKQTEKKKFNQVKSFNENYCLVRQANRWGYLDSNGVLSIHTKYATAYNFSEGRARVRVNNKFGYLDYAGRLVIAPIYSSAIDFYDNKALVKPKSGFCYYIDPEGKILYQTTFGQIPSANLKGKYFIRRNNLETESATIVYSNINRAYTIGPNLYKIYKDQRITGILRQPILVCQRNMSLIQEVKEIGDVNADMIRYTSTLQFGLLNFEGKEITPAINGRIEYESGLIKVTNWSNVSYLKLNGEALTP